jgi:hypothetical protein
MGRVLRDHFQALICLSEHKFRWQLTTAAGLDHPRIVFQWSRKIRGSDCRRGIAESDGAAQEER